MAIIKPNNNTISAITALPASITTGKVLQVVQTVKTTTFTVSGTSDFTDVTGMSVNITPSSTSSKILVDYTTFIGCSNDSRVHIALVRGSTYLFVGTSAGSRTASSGFFYTQTDVAGQIRNVSGTFLDAPSSTSQQTYKIRIYTSGGTASFNCTQNDSNNGYQPRTASSITVSEIA